MIILFHYMLMVPGNASSSNVPPLPIGNFALPKSQQPGSYYSFGSSILEPGQLQMHTTPNVFKSTGERFIGLPMTLLYGTSERTSLLFTLPTTPLFTKGHIHHSGIGDVGLQGEYRVYDRTSLTDKEHADIMAGFTEPSGSKNFTAGMFSYFFGATYNHAWQDWIWFVAPGVLQFGGKSQTRLAARYYYELGVGRNIDSLSDKYIFTAFLEVNGQYDNKNPSSVPVTRHSGGHVLSDGNLLFISPSIWFSTKQWATQLGASLPITQNWYGTREKVNYYVAASVIYTFNPSNSN